MNADPVLAQIREIRHQISEKCGHDPKRLIEYYMQLEKEKYADRLVKPDQVRKSSEPDLSA